MAAKTSGRKQNGHNDSMCAIQIVIMAMWLNINIVCLPQIPAK
jgi:hypothetical protein